MIEDLKQKIQEYGLTLEQYESCLSDAYDKANHKVDLDWQEIVNKYGLDIHFDTLRKATQTIFGGAFVSEYFKSKYAEAHSDDTYLQELRAEKQELRKEKQRMFDERTELNKKLREQARIENDLEYLQLLVKSRAIDSMPQHNIPEITSDNDLAICISDFHFGADNNTYFGKYNSDIAAERLNIYFQKIIEIQKTHHSQNAYILMLGDLLNGEIHFTTQLENRENLTEQVQKCAELLSSFIYELSKYFENVFVNGVAGNHSRTSFKDQVLRGNRLDNLIPWYMKASLQHLENVKFIDENNYDSTISNISVRGNDYLLVHGDYDCFNQKGISKLVLMLGFKPTGIFMGHMHHNSYDDICGIKMIRSGCFSGTGDDYCVSKRIYGKPAQMVAVLDKTGVKACYPIDL